MALSEFEQARIKRLFRAYCEIRIPEPLRTTLRIDFRIGDDDVILYELRPHYQQPDIWYSTAVARFVKQPDQNLWSLYSADRNDQWLPYLPYHGDRNIEKLLAVVNDDPLGLFWG